MKPNSSGFLPVRPAQLVEQKIITGILDGTFTPGDVLPSERQLAETFGVARPPLRETLHRLATEGWLTIAHGKPTRINDFWEKGGMGLLGTLAKYIDTLPPEFVIHLMEIRSRLLPIIAGLAVDRAPHGILELLMKAERLDDDAHAFVEFDWRLLTFMAAQTGNPIYTLMINDFAGVFATLAVAYFSISQARTASYEYYRALGAAIRDGGHQVEAVVQNAMEASVALWEIFGGNNG